MQAYVKTLELLRPGVSEVELNFCDIGVVQVHRMKYELKKCRQLKRLTLSKVRTVRGEQDGLMLAEVVEGLTRLEYINLGQNLLSDREFVMVIPSLVAMTSLREIWIPKNNISYDGLAKYQEALVSLGKSTELEHFGANSNR